MKLNRLITLVLFGIALLATAGTDIPSNTTEQPDGRTILEKTLSAPVPTSFGAVYDITHTDHHDRKKERRALLFFAVDDKDPLVRKQVISFLEPRDLKGTALLTENRMGWGEDYSSNHGSTTLSSAAPSSTPSATGATVNSVPP